ncbi:MAG TPA: bifunctional [glutamate--ammonia ligase]-adenylyl-L-tyrosine phosphorylase/[glutamate--ammonia-ligase] adenylyltransferase, partial [Verrucomicrobiae bacterium]|nr:bifunctional [glutamate--ammonia ligase]-adenylyl-L-tyrosine phosphorylase/[glutamate--ammonia-ligase] adenylyltransferase [Verrucomicrobiae bacterium]
MNRGELLEELRRLLDQPEPLTRWLEGNGFSYTTRSCENIRLLSQVLPSECVVAAVAASLSAPVPDMALNNLERIASGSPSDIAAICSSRTQLAQLLRICGSSPFLVNILCRDPSALAELFGGRLIELRRSEGESLAALRRFAGDIGDYPSLLPLLRRFKYREVLRIGARDLNGLAPLEEVTAELAALASSTLQVAYEGALRHLTREYGTPLEEDGTPAEFTIIGMGKLGGGELNFSSDIDLIYFYSSGNGATTGIPDGQGGVKGVLPLHAFFVRLGEMVTKAISQVTPDGFVFRVDLGLRPEGKSGDIAVSQRAAEVYYESWGQSWERAAMLKARPVAGSIDLGERILEALEPFIYRKYLDYTLIEDMM